jgi:hypothetical protein
MHLEEDLRRYEGLTEELGRTTITSRKSLTRATRMMQEATECHERMMQHVAALSSAMSDTRARQQACAEKLVSVSVAIQARMAAYESLLVRYGQLGDVSRALNAQAAEVAARDGAEMTDVLQATGQLQERLDAAITEATTLADAARVDDFSDLTRDADSLKQQLQSARNQLLLARRALTERAPS